MEQGETPPGQWGWGLADGPSPESQNSDPEPVSPNAHILQMGKLSHKEQTGLGATEWGNPEVYLARFLGCFKRKKSPFSPQRQRTAGSTSPCGAASAKVRHFQPWLGGL